jgi:hypothetical protein
MDKVVAKRGDLAEDSTKAIHAHSRSASPGCTVCTVSPTVGPPTSLHVMKDCRARESSWPG